jgi:hypothetical protein
MALAVADAVTPNWESEDIPDADRLFMRLHPDFIYEDGTPKPNGFRNHGGGMSTDWDKYSTPEQTRARTDKDPRTYAVIAMVVGEVRKIEGQEVKHTPLPDNRAHADVTGEKRGGDPETRMLFRRIATVVIPYISSEKT